MIPQDRKLLYLELDTNINNSQLEFKFNVEQTENFAKLFVLDCVHDHHKRNKNCNFLNNKQLKILIGAFNTIFLQGNSEFNVNKEKIIDLLQNLCNNDNVHVGCQFCNFEKESHETMNSPPLLGNYTFYDDAVCLIGAQNHLRQAATPLQLWEVRELEASKFMVRSVTANLIFTNNSGKSLTTQFLYNSANNDKNKSHFSLSKSNGMIAFSCFYENKRSLSEDYVDSFNRLSYNYMSDRNRIEEMFILSDLIFIKYISDFTHLMVCKALEKHYNEKKKIDVKVVIKTNDRMLCVTAWSIFGIHSMPCDDIKKNN